MFCYQCEQTSKGEGCTKIGVCGKTADVAAHLSEAKLSPERPAAPAPSSGRVLRNRRWSRRLERDGFVRFQLLPATRAQQVRQGLLRIVGPPPDALGADQFVDTPRRFA